MNDETINRPKLTAGEKWLVAFTLICLAFWLSDFYLCAIKLFPAVVDAPPFAVLTALVAVGLGGFAWRTVAFVRTRTVACAHEQGKKHFVLSLLAAIFWTALAVILLVGTYENIYYSMKVRSFDDFLEVAPINAALVTPTVTAVYFILLTILRMKNRRNGEMRDQIHE